MTTYRILVTALLGVSMSTLRPQHAPLPLPAWQLHESRDSFVINIQGKPMGFTVLSVEATRAGYRVTENTQIGGMMQQRTELLLDKAHRLRQVNQSGKMRGQDARIAIEYDGKRVRGAATMPGPEGGHSFMIDLPVPANVIDDNLLQSIFPVLPWSADANWTIPVFSAGKNQLSETTLVVTGSESVNNVESYRAELRGGEMTVAIWVAKAAPHRVLKTAPVGAPFEMIRAN